MNERTSKSGFRVLDAVERIGNKLPDPVTLFFIGAMLVLLASHVAASTGWSIRHPATDEVVVAKDLLSRSGIQWIWLSMVKNFTSFAPLGVVLTALLGIGVAERSGLISACLKGLVQITPAKLLTPAVIFVGVNSSIATDAGFVVLPPLAAAVFARAGRAPLVGLAAVFAGIAAGFSANLLLTGLDPLLQGFTESAAQMLEPSRYVRADCNWFFMIGSTFFITIVGWGVTKWFVEPRFSKDDIAAQIAHSNLSNASDAGSNGLDDRKHLSRDEIHGLMWAALIAMVGCIGVACLIAIPGAPLHGEYPKPPTGKQAPIWPDVIVPLLFVLFLLPGIAYGVVLRKIRSDRDVARMMGEAMSSMGMYIVMAFFAAQFIEWFRESNLSLIIAVKGADSIAAMNMPRWMTLATMIAMVAMLNLLIASASAKWGLLAAVLVPMFMRLGFSPELTQAAYRVGDSSTNPIAPLNPYVVVILVFMQKYLPKVGLGTLMSLMLPYSVTILIAWIALLLTWVAFGWPLGPGGEAHFIK